jgi:hypothetical protein
VVAAAVTSAGLPEGTGVVGAVMVGASDSVARSMLDTLDCCGALLMAGHDPFEVNRFMGVRQARPEV